MTPPCSNGETALEEKGVLDVAGRLWSWRLQAYLPGQVDKQKHTELWCLGTNIWKIELWRKSEIDYHKSQDADYFFEKRKRVCGWTGLLGWVQILFTHPGVNVKDICFVSIYFTICFIQLLISNTFYKKNTGYSFSYILFKKHLPNIKRRDWK